MRSGLKRYSAIAIVFVLLASVLLSTTAFAETENKLCFPDADEMTFPLENVREVSAE